MAEEYFILEMDVLEASVGLQTEDGVAVHASKDGGTPSVCPIEHTTSISINIPSTEDVANTGASFCTQVQVSRKMDCAKSIDASAVFEMDCRICLERDDINNLETPCACSGSVKYTHRKCVHGLCNEKGNTRCEICHLVQTPRAPRAVFGGEGGMIVGGPLYRQDGHGYPGVVVRVEQHVYDTEEDNVVEATRRGTTHQWTFAILYLFVILRIILQISRGLRNFSFLVLLLFLHCFIMLQTVLEQFKIMRRARATLATEMELSHV